MADPRFLRTDFESCCAHAVEEAGEFLAAAGKLLRFGPMSVNPLLPEADRETNLDWMMREGRDLAAAIVRLQAARPIPGLPSRPPMAAAVRGDLDFSACVLQAVSLAARFVEKVAKGSFPGGLGRPGGLGAFSLWAVIILAQDLGEALVRVHVAAGRIDWSAQRAQPAVQP